MATRVTTASGPTADRLERALERAQREMAALTTSFATIVIESTTQTARTLLAEWSATLAAQTEFVERELRGLSDVNERRSAIERARRDVTRWQRRVLEREEAALRGVMTASHSTAWVTELSEQIAGWPTVSAPLDAASLEGVHGSLVKRFRVWRTKQMIGRQRGVPLARLAAAELWPLLEIEFSRAMHDAHGLRVLAWRRFRGAALEWDELWTAAGRRILADEAVDWDALRHDAAEGITAIVAEIDRAAADVRRHLERAVQDALRALRLATTLCDTPLYPLTRLPQGALDTKTTLAEMTVFAKRWEDTLLGLHGEVVAILDGLTYLAALRYALRRDAAALSVALEQRLVMPLTELALLPLDDFRQQAVLWCDGGELRSDVREAVEEVFTEIERSSRRAGERVAHHIQVLPAATLHVAAHEPPPSDHSRRIELRAVADEQVGLPLRQLLARLANDVEESVDSTLADVADVLRVLELDNADNGTPLHGEDWRARVRARLATAQRSCEKRVATHVADLGMGVPQAWSAFDEQLQHLDHQLTKGVPTATSTRLPIIGGAKRAPDTLPREVIDAESLLEVTSRMTLQRHVNRAVTRDYWRLLGSNAGQSTALDLGLQREASDVMRCVRAWEDGDPEAVAITGPVGSGRRILLDRVERELAPSYPVVRFRVEQRLRTADDVAESFAQQLAGDQLDENSTLGVHLKKGTERRVVIVEAGELLFLRHVAGLDGVRWLLRLIDETAERVLWIVSFDTVAFQFLSSLLHLSEAFTRIIPIEPLDARELRSFIEERHRPSGLEVRFQRKAGETEDEARDRFYDDLLVRSYGHPPLALFWWLMSSAEHGGRIDVSLPPEPPAEMLSPLSGQKCAGLSALLLHGGLSAPDFADAMRMSPESASAMLATFRHLHVAELSSLTGRVHVGAVRYMPTAHELQRRHLL